MKGMWRSRQAIACLIFAAVALATSAATCGTAPEQRVPEATAGRPDVITPTAASTQSSALTPKASPTLEPTATAALAATPVPTATPTSDSVPAPTPTATADPIPAVTVTPTPRSTPCPTAAEEEYLGWLNNDLLVYSEAAMELGDILTIFEVNPQLGFTDEFNLAFDRPADRLRRASRNIIDLFPISGRIATRVHTIAERMARTTIDSVNLFADAIDNRDRDKFEEAGLLFVERVLPDLLALGWAIEHLCESSSAQAVSQATTVRSGKEGSASTPTPTANPTQSPTSVPAQAFKVVGIGTDAREITLAAGLWRLTMEVSKNSECVGETCIAALFAVEVETVGSAAYELAANTIAEDWQGSVALRAGSELLDLAPGKQVVSVTAALTAEWTLTFRPTSGAETAGGAQESIEIPVITASTGPTTESGQSISVSGNGTDVREIELADGLWTLHMEMSRNRDCVLGTCVAALFAVEVESVAGTGYELAANTIAEDWQGTVAFRVGSELLDLAPGNQIVSITAASTGEWILTFRLTAS